jgi:outer membrane protein OmpA-like peptidoglycan-associated protein
MLWVMRHRLPPPASSQRWSGRHGRSLAAIGAAVLLSGCITGTTRTTPTDVDRPLRIITNAADAALYMDTQAYELKEALANSGVTIERNRDDIVLRMPGAAAFEPDKAEITPAYRKSVAAAAQVLASYDRTLIDVSGHTDSTGAMIRNMTLSLERAEAVVQLLKKAGIDEARITPRGLGPMEPLADNDSADGRQINRRVELTIRPLMHLP